MKTTEIVIYGIIILVVIAAAFLINNKDNSNQSGNVTIQITSNGPWVGNYAYNNGNIELNGTGNANYNLGPNPGHVTVSLQNNGNGTLTVQLLQGTNIVQSQSTSNYLGVVNIDQNF